ncbi:TlpA family protein disulfide reductase, partial [Bacteroides ovatus]
KYVLIDFWASWCGPCRHEMPNVKAAYEKYASKGFEVISISTDRKLKPWRAAVEELGMNWVQLLDVDASDIYGIHAIPRTFLVDPTGIVIDKNLRGEKLEEALSKLFE